MRRNLGLSRRLNFGSPNPCEAFANRTLASETTAPAQRATATMSIYGDGPTETISTPEAGGGMAGGAKVSAPDLTVFKAKLAALEAKDWVIIALGVGVLYLILEGTGGVINSYTTSGKGGSAAVHYSHCDTSTGTVYENGESRPNNRFMMDDLVCDNNAALTLDECTYIAGDGHNCGGSEGVYVSCASTTCKGQPPPPPPPPFSGTVSAIRVVSNQYQATALSQPVRPLQGGILQAQVDGVWGNVCDDFFDANCE